MPQKKGFNPGISELEYGLAEAVYHWINYVITCGNDRLIEEHSIRYPLSEFIERKYKAEVSLEQTTTLLKSKRYDFYYQMPETRIGEGTNGYIEVKYLRDDTQYSSEINRFFADLVRLAISGGRVNYFILFGERVKFETCFKHVGKLVESEEFVKARFSGKNIEDVPYGIYSKWFGFDVKTTIDFNVDAFPENKEFFTNTHKDKENNTIPIDGLTIRTQLLAVMPKNEDKSSQVVYIWQVSKVY